MYHAAQWTAFAFGIIATVLGIVFFRGVGAVGHRGPKEVGVSESEKGEQGDELDHEKLPGAFSKTDNIRDGDVTQTTNTQVSLSPEQIEKLGV